MPGPMSVPNGNTKLLALHGFWGFDPDRKCERSITVAEQRQRLLRKNKLDTGKTRRKRE